MLMHKSKSNQCQKWNKYTIPVVHKSQALSYLSFGCVAIWLSVNKFFGLSELRPVQFYQIVCVCVLHVGIVPITSIQSHTFSLAFILIWISKTAIYHRDS